jgi:hypothetical protein
LSGGLIRVFSNQLPHDPQRLGHVPLRREQGAQDVADWFSDGKVIRSVSPPTLTSPGIPMDS